jgi:hypothetical protein
MKRENPQTSIDAYTSLDPERLRKMYKDILWALGQTPEGATFEQLARMLKVKDAQVWRRLAEIEKMYLIHRDGRRVLSSGRFGSIWKNGPPGSEPTVEKALPGKSVADYSREIIQPSLF